MAGKRFDPDWLARFLEPHGFVLNLPESMKGGISFVRPSSVDRLFEHVQFRTGQVAWVETLISGATFTICHKCVSETDGRLRDLISEGNQFGKSQLSTWAEARAWQKRVIEHADAYCKMMAAEISDLLFHRLEPIFNAVDSYTQALGDMDAIFDREFAFVSAGDCDENAEVERLADLAWRWLYLNLDDAKLASIALVRFGTQVERQPSPFQGKLPRRDEGLAARLVLLTDYLRAKRLEYSSHRRF